MEHEPLPPKTRIQRLKSSALSAVLRIAHDALTYGPLSDEFKASVAAGTVKTAEKVAQKTNTQGGQLRRHYIDTGYAPHLETQVSRMKADLAHLQDPDITSAQLDTSHTQDKQ